MVALPAVWDPERYLAFADERTRPYLDLLARVGGAPQTVADLGCGPGHLTAHLHARWPQAAVTGIDSSPEMIARAQQEHERRPAGAAVYVEADLQTWRPESPVDLLVSAATFQWVPDHVRLMRRWAAAVAPGGTFAFTVPANFDEPSHRLLREIATSDPYGAHTAGVEWPAAHDAHTYLDSLATSGWRVDAWETMYLHVLDGTDPVLRWISGTGARPVLQALDAAIAPAGLRARFEASYGAALREAYPPTPYGTVLPFRRVFVVAQRLATN